MGLGSGLVSGSVVRVRVIVIVRVRVRVRVRISVRVSTAGVAPRLVDKASDSEAGLLHRDPSEELELARLTESRTDSRF